MRKLVLLFLMLIVIALSSCLPQTQVRPLSTATSISRLGPTALVTVPTQAALVPNSSCTVVTLKPTPGPTPETIYPPVSTTDWVKGPDSAKITVVEYADFQDPFSATLAPVMDQLRKDFPNDLRFVYRHFPLIGTPESPFHDKAALATQAAEASGEQGKFWEMHDVLFNNQSEWAALSAVDFQQWLITKASELKLDVPKFTTDLTSPELVSLAQKAWDDGQKMKLIGTPTLFINGDDWPGNVTMSEANISSVIKLVLLEDRQFTECPPMTIDPTKQYIATLHTEKGDIAIELAADKAPLAVNSFIFLAQHGWFDNVTFHRVIPGLWAQAGDPTGTGFGTPGYAFKNEKSDLKFDGPGVVAMANAGVDTNGSQFFITYDSLPNLDGKYTIFGHVIQGYDVVTNLTPRDPSQSGDLPPGDKILSVSIAEK
jgi:cyclophilin family peptidyl-prolyl cis-trans isomerase/protein-disulfide isomerase